ncbi:hypothetical protein V8F06_014638 [Rhypophila decipiens]
MSDYRQKLKISVFPSPDPSYSFPLSGTAALLVIPTDNKSKTDLLISTFQSKLPTRYSALHNLTLPVSSEVGEQPYNGAGPIGAYNRIRNALDVLSNSSRHINFTREKNIGTLMVAAIENYIEIDRCPARPTDYGVVVVHNASTGKTSACVSSGTTIDSVWVDRARKLGVDGHEDHGKVTVGRVLAERMPGIDEANWHVVLAGRSRYDILREAVEGLELPWGGME